MIPPVGNRNGSEWVLDADLFEFYQTALSTGFISRDVVAQWIENLMPNKAARVLAQFDDHLAADLFRRISSKNLWLAVEILLHARESSHEPDACLGLGAARLLDDSSPGENVFTLGLLSMMDPVYASYVGDRRLSGSRPPLMTLSVLWTRRSTG